MTARPAPSAQTKASGAECPEPIFHEGSSVLQPPGERMEVVGEQGGLPRSVP